MKLNLTQGISDNTEYKASKFPGGEIHFKLKGFEVNIPISRDIDIVTRLNTSDDIMLLLIAVDTIKKDIKDVKITLTLPYMPYQQADRDFSVGECFSLKTVANLINSMGFDSVSIFDPHSDVTPALINNCKVIDNSGFIKDVISSLYKYRYNQVMNTLSLPDNPDYDKKMSGSYTLEDFHKELIVLAPDAGAYKKIFKLCEKIGFKGQIESCSKSRDYVTQNITMKIPEFDKGKLVLIVDDICLGGRTFINIAKEIENTCYIAVSHGVFDSGGYGDPMPALEEAFEGIFTTNSRKDASAYDGNTKVIIFPII